MPDRSAPDRFSRITPTQFRERARAWLLRHAGYIPRDHDVKLGEELERVYEEGRIAGSESGRDEQKAKDP